MLGITFFILERVVQNICPSFRNRKIILFFFLQIPSSLPPPDNAKENNDSMENVSIFLNAHPRESSRFKEAEESVKNSIEVLDSIVKESQEMMENANNVLKVVKKIRKKATKQLSRYNEILPLLETPEEFVMLLKKP